MAGATTSYTTSLQLPERRWRPEHSLSNSPYLNVHLRAHDKRLSELLGAHPNPVIFTSSPGIGPVTAGVLISEMGEARTRFPSAPSLLAETRLVPVTKASGRTREARFRWVRILWRCWHDHITYDRAVHHRMTAA